MESTVRWSRADKQIALYCALCLALYLTERLWTVRSIVPLALTHPNFCIRTR